MVPARVAAEAISELTLKPDQSDRADQCCWTEPAPLMSFAKVLPGRPPPVKSLAWLNTSAPLLTTAPVPGVPISPENVSLICSVPLAMVATPELLLAAPAPKQ